MRRDELRARLIAEREQRQAQAVAIVDRLPQAHILEEVAATGARLRAKWDRHPVELCDLELLDINARALTELRERESERRV